MHDASGSGEDYYLVRESVKTVHATGSYYDAQILKVRLNKDRHLRPAGRHRLARLRCC